MSIDLSNFLASHPYADATRRTYKDVLSRLFARSQDLANITAAELIELLKKSGWGNARQCVALAAAQKYFTWQYGHSHPALGAKLKRIQGKPQRALNQETALKLLASFDRHDPKGARDLAMCSLDLDTGLRAAEMCGLLQAHVDTEHCALQVLVKGGQWEAAIFSEETAAHIEHWKHFRKVADGKGYLFTNIQTREGLTSQGYYSIVKEWGLKIGIKLSPHDLRRSFAVLGTMNGASERVLMEGGRWKSSTMIKRYTRTLKLEAMRKYLPVAGLSDGDNL